MALFNDGPINRIEELALHDSSLLETSTIEGIDVAAKIANAQDAIATEVLTFLLDNKPVSWKRRTAGVADVVVTAELKRWHTFRSLHGVYMDAHGHQSNDRYTWKWEEYGALTRTAKARCLDVGIGLAVDPIPRAQAPLVTTVAGGGAAATIYFAAALVNAAGQEGLASEVVMVNVATGMLAQVRLSAAPANANGWNVFAGGDPGMLMRQNDGVLDVSGSWTQPGAPTAGSAPGNGQAAMFFAVQNRVIRRG
jgi:hypothetical protein